MASSDDRLVTFRGGFTASLEVVQRLLTIESRGAQFVSQADGRFRVDPPSAMTPEDATFLKAHRDEARRVLSYTADDSHLWDDKSQAQPARLAKTEPQKVSA